MEKNLQSIFFLKGLTLSCPRAMSLDCNSQSSPSPVPCPSLTKRGLNRNPASFSHTSPLKKPHVRPAHAAADNKVRLLWLYLNGFPDEGKKASASSLAIVWLKAYASCACRLTISQLQKDWASVRMPLCCTSQDSQGFSRMPIQLSGLASSRR